MNKPLLYDVFCGGGGATKGYMDAGFRVIGVDNRPQPRYPGSAFIQMDALDFLEQLARGEFELADAIHASPPCQAFTQMSARWRGRGGKADSHPDLLAPTRAALLGRCQPWVIENVQGAKRHMNETLRLHGGLFDLGVHRPRLFESNILILAPQASRVRFPIGVYGTKPDGHTTYYYRNAGNYAPGGPPVSKSLIRTAKSIEEASAAMGIDWMTWDEIREAIPPAYTEFIGRALIQYLTSAPRASAAGGGA